VVKASLTANQRIKERLGMAKGNHTTLSHSTTGNFSLKRFQVSKQRKVPLLNFLTGISALAIGISGRRLCISTKLSDRALFHNHSPFLIMEESLGPILCPAS